jgi:hypothetical protein
MARRHEPPNSLEYFPTPLWAVRALFRHVLPALGIKEVGSVWEPACGEGHMAAVIAEFAREPVIATDIFDYGYSSTLVDFLDAQLAPKFTDCAWIITNPPFSVACDFTLRALELATEGVAMLVRTQWIEGAGRYERLFRDRPPTLYAPFVERVPIIRGRWDPDASTATSYAWFVWCKDRSAMPRIFWIPPGCRSALTNPDDRRRFAGSPQSDAPLFPRFPLGIKNGTSTTGAGS